MAPPVGIEIGKGSKKWTIGKMLGTGACATVYALKTADGNETEYAVKVAPIPTKKTKKGNSPAETNVSLLHYEQLVYQVSL